MNSYIIPVEDSNNPVYTDKKGRAWKIIVVALEPVSFSYPSRTWFKVRGDGRKQEVSFVAGFTDTIEALNHFMGIADNLPL